tara:strand:+ start:196 stop:417 length:222 start_codon:yes stop_codon:yes gene_type:complete
MNTTSSRTNSDSPPLKPGGREKLGMDIGRTPQARARMKARNAALRAQGIDPNQGPGRAAWGATPLFPNEAKTS